MFDGMITCWGIKYREKSRSDPITYINRYMDKNWKPLIQTPPFPEYHQAVIARFQEVAALFSNLCIPTLRLPILQKYPFGFAPRNFKSATEAGREASDSRVLWRHPLTNLGVGQRIC